MPGTFEHKLRKKKILKIKGEIDHNRFKIVLINRNKATIRETIMKATMGSAHIPIETEMDIIDAKKLEKRPFMVDKMVPKTPRAALSIDLTKLSDPERISPWNHVDAYPTVWL